MGTFRLGNTTKEITNNVFTSVRTDTIDARYYYSEIFNTIPIYECKYSIKMTDDVESSGELKGIKPSEIYEKIFQELISNDFTPLMYQYSNEDDNVDINTKGAYYTERFIVISNSEPLLIYFQYNEFTILTHLGVEKINETVDKFLKKYHQEDNSKVKCHIIANDNGLYLNEFTINIDGDLDCDLYNDGFDQIHDTIVKSINEDNNGLYLLYGKPGTGKTTFIRHLIKECGTDKREFVYVPSNLFGEFTSPNVLPFLLNHKGCIFIIEDCESLVTNEQGVRSSSITDLLNMTDGILADAMNIKIICTFNVDDGKIDEALLRPGRCKCKYEFDLLDKDKANMVAEKLGLNKVDKDVSLAELFNSGVNFKEKKKKKLGF